MALLGYCKVKRKQFVLRFFQTRDWFGKWRRMGLTLWWKRSLSYRNQYICFLYDKNFRHERVKWKHKDQIKFEFLNTSSVVALVMNFTEDVQVFMKLKIFYLLSPTLVFMWASTTPKKLLKIC